MSTTSQQTSQSQSIEQQETPVDDFEKSIGELETLVESLENGDVSLKEALDQFERGVNLSQRCQAMLQSAELRIEQLTSDSSDEQITQPTTDESSHQTSK